MKRWFGVSALVMLAIIVAMPAQAQGNTKKQVQGYIAGGYTLAEGGFGDYFNDGWQLSGGAILRPAPDKPIALRFDLGYNWFGANNNLINLAQGAGLRVNDGNASLGTLTAEAMYEFGGNGGVGGFVGLGLGGIHRYANVTTTVNSGIWCSPWYPWYCYPASSNAIVQSESLTKMDYSLSAGVTFPVGNGEMYVEARYHWMLNAQPSTQMLPILLGYRF